MGGTIARPSWSTLVALSLVTLGTSGLAQPVSNEVERCVGLRKQATAARNAMDWPSQEQLATTLVSTCRHILASWDIAWGYYDIANANHEMKKSQRALDASERCILTQYDMPDCHLEQGWALHSLGREDEALKAIERAERQAYACVERAERSLRATIVDKQVHEADRDECRSTRKLCKEIFSASKAGKPWPWW